MTKFLTGTAAIALMALSGAASAADLKMSHVRPQDTTIDKELRAFAAEVSEATGGDVTINIFPASALGDPGHAPARACGEAKLARPELRVEIIVTAAC